MGTYTCNLCGFNTDLWKEMQGHRVMGCGLLGDARSRESLVLLKSKGYSADEICAALDGRLKEKSCEK